MIQTLTSLRDSPYFDRAINWAVFVLVACIVGTFVSTLADVGPWPQWETRSSRADLSVDPFFAALYTIVAVLYLQNIRFFHQTRQPLYLTYCLYITFVAAFTVLYERLVPGLSAGTLEIWGVATSQTCIGIAYVYIFRFARQLLKTEEQRPRADRVLKAGMAAALVPPVLVYMNAIEWVTVADSLWMLVFGSLLLVVTAQSALMGKRVAMVFCLSFAAQYLGFIWSSVIFFFPDQADAVTPFYQADRVRASSAIYIGSLAVEALLMSFAAQIFMRDVTNRAEAAEDRASRLDQALKAAKAHMAAAARQDAKDSAAPDSDTAAHGDAGLVQAMRHVIVQNAAEPFLDVTFLVRAMATSEATLGRRLKSETGLTPSAFIRLVRLELARDLLRGGQAKTVGDAAAKAGFGNLGHFSTRYKAAFNESPSETLKSAQ